MIYHIRRTSLLTEEEQAHLHFGWISLLEHAKDTAQAYGVELRLTPKRTTLIQGTKMLVNGYFLSRPAILEVACKKPQKEWLQIFLHESCHMDQWRFKTCVWNRTFITDDIDTLNLVDLWIERKIGLNNKQLDEYITASRNVELDCEKRSVKKIKQYGLPIDSVEYIQRANAYVCFYTLLKKTRQWYSKKAPYDDPNVWKQMPTKWLNDYSKLPKSIEKALLLTL